MTSQKKGTLNPPNIKWTQNAEISENMEKGFLENVEIKLSVVTEN